MKGEVWEFLNTLPLHILTWTPAVPACSKGPNPILITRPRVDNTDSIFLVGSRFRVHATPVYAFGFQFITKGYEGDGAFGFKIWDLHIHPKRILMLKA